MNAMQDQAGSAANVVGSLSRKMDESSEKLSDTYASFVEKITGGFSRALGMFDENIHSVLSAMNDKLEEIRALSKQYEQNDRYQQEAEGCITALSRLQRAIRTVFHFTLPVLRIKGEWQFGKPVLQKWKRNHNFRTFL